MAHKAWGLDILARTELVPARPDPDKGQDHVSQPSWLCPLCVWLRAKAARLTRPGTPDQLSSLLCSCIFLQSDLPIGQGTQRYHCHSVLGPLGTGYSSEQGQTHQRMKFDFNLTLTLRSSHCTPPDLWELSLSAEQSIKDFYLLAWLSGGLI